MALPIWELALLAVLLGFLFTSLRLGYRKGARSHREAQAMQPQVGAIQGATLGLLALLLGFSFAGASSRYMDRQNLIIDLANAIDTARLRAEILPSPDNAVLQAALLDFTRTHLRISGLMGMRDLDGCDQALKDAHAKLWTAARDAAIKHPSSQITILAPINQSIDLSTKRLAMARSHLPLEIVILLVASAGLSVFVLGYGCGLTHQPHRLLTHTLTVLITMALWSIVDLDFPRLGMIQISDRPLQQLLP
jgi:hypothetical protein